jgi:hypothetical protein
MKNQPGFGIDGLESLMHPFAYHAVPIEQSHRNYQQQGNLQF